MINIKNCFQVNGIFQLCFCAYRRETFYKVGFFPVDTAHNNIGVSDINS